MLTRISNCNARLIAFSSRTAAAVAAASTLAAASPALAQRLVERRLNVISSSLSLNHSWSLPQQEFIKWKDTLQVSSIEEAILRSPTEIQIETQSQSQFLPQWVLLYLLSTKVHSASQALSAVNLMLLNFPFIPSSLQPYVIILLTRQCAKHNLPLPIYNLIKLFLILPQTHPSSPSPSSSPLNIPTRLFNLLLRSLSLFRSPETALSSSTSTSFNPSPSSSSDEIDFEFQEENIETKSISFLITHVLSTMSARQISLYPHTYRTLLSSPSITLEIVKRLERHVPPSSIQQSQTTDSPNNANSGYMYNPYSGSLPYANTSYYHYNSKYVNNTPPYYRSDPYSKSQLYKYGEDDENLGIEHLEAYLRLFAKRGAVHASARYLNLIRKRKIMMLENGTGGVDIGGSSGRNTGNTRREYREEDEYEDDYGEDEFGFGDGVQTKSRRSRRKRRAKERARAMTNAMENAEIKVPYGVSLTRFGPRVGSTPSDTTVGGPGTRTGAGTEMGTGQSTHYNTIFLSALSRHTGSAFKYLRDMVMIEEERGLRRGVTSPGYGSRSQHKNDLEYLSSIFNLTPTPRLSTVTWRKDRYGRLTPFTSLSQMFSSLGRASLILRIRLKNPKKRVTKLASSSAFKPSLPPGSIYPTSPFSDPLSPTPTIDPDTQYAYLTALHVATKDENVKPRELIWLFDASTTGSVPPPTSPDSDTPEDASTASSPPSKASSSTAPHHHSQTQPGGSDSQYEPTPPPPVTVRPGAGGIPLSVGAYTMLMRGLVKRKAYALAARVWDALVDWVGDGEQGQNRVQEQNQSQVQIQVQNFKEIASQTNTDSTISPDPGSISPRQTLQTRRRLNKLRSRVQLGNKSQIPVWKGGRRSIDRKALTVGMEVLVLSGQCVRAVETLVECTGLLVVSDENEEGVKGNIPYSPTHPRINQKLVNSLMYAFLKVHRPEVVFYIWDIYTPLFGIEPNAESLTAVLRAAKIVREDGLGPNIGSGKGYGSELRRELGRELREMREEVRDVLEGVGNTLGIGKLFGKNAAEEGEEGVGEEEEDGEEDEDGEGGVEGKKGKKNRKRKRKMGWKGEGEGITKSEMVRRLVEVIETGQYTAIPHSSKPSVQPTIPAKSSAKKIPKERVTKKKHREINLTKEALTNLDKVVLLYKEILVGNYPWLRGLKDPARAVWPDRGKAGFLGIRVLAHGAAGVGFEDGDNESGGGVGNNSSGTGSGSAMGDAFGFVVSNVRERVQSRDGSVNTSAATTTSAPSTQASSSSILVGPSSSLLTRLSIRNPSSSNSNTTSSPTSNPHTTSNSNSIPNFYTPFTPFPYIKGHIPSHPQITPSEKSFSALLSLLSVLNRRSEVASVLGWMRALGVMPTKGTLGMALADWGQVAFRGPVFEEMGRREGGGGSASASGNENEMRGNENGNEVDERRRMEEMERRRSVIAKIAKMSEYEKLRVWLVDWLGEDGVPTESQVGAWVRRLNWERERGE